MKRMLSEEWGSQDVTPRWPWIGGRSTVCTPVDEVHPLKIVDRRPWKVKLGKLSAAAQVDEIFVDLPVLQNVLSREK